MVTLIISGETNDQIIVHWPEKDVLFPADNLYRAFPNLYAIRGTASRYFFPYFHLNFDSFDKESLSLKIRACGYGDMRTGSNQVLAATLTLIGMREGTFIPLSFLDQIFSAEF